MGTRAITFLALALVGCGGKLVASSGEVRFAAGAVDFGQVWTSHPSVRPIVLRNEARNSDALMLPFFWLQSLQAKAKLVELSGPRLLRGWM